MKAIAIFKKKHIPWLILIAIFLVWGAVRSCSAMNQFGPNYTFTIARDPSWYPLNLMGKDKSITGFTDELLFAIAEEQNFKVEIVSAPSGILFDELEEGDFDAVISTLAPTALTMQKFQFSHPYFLVGPVLIVPMESKVTSLQELDNKTLAVKRGSHIIFDISQHKVSFSPYDSMTVAFEDLQNDHIDGIVMPLLPAYTFTQLFYPGTLKIATAPLSNEGMRVITLRSHEGQVLVELFDKGLQELKKSGAYDKILKKWGLFNPEILQKKS